MAYRLLVDELHERLADRGWTDVRPAFGFVLLALRDGPASLRDLPDVLGTTKQAVSKLVDAMVATGYVQRVADPGDGRAKRVQLSARGQALLADVEQIWADLEAGWVADPRRRDGSTSCGPGLETVLRAAHGGSLPPVRTVG